jgi:hypothetical protein
MWHGHVTVEVVEVRYLRMNNTNYIISPRSHCLLV